MGTLKSHTMHYKVCTIVQHILCEQTVVYIFSDVLLSMYHVMSILAAWKCVTLVTSVNTELIKKIYVTPSKVKPYSYTY